MGGLTRLSGKVVAVDSPAIIYYVEENPTFLPMVRPFFEAVRRGEISVITSAITMTEVLVHPLKRGKTSLVDEFRNLFLNVRHVQTISVSPEIAEVAAKLRADHGIRTPDAIHAATAIQCNADFFLTNDDQLKVLTKPSVVMIPELVT